MKKPNITPGPWRIKSSNKTASLEIIGGDKFHHISTCDGKRQESHFQAQQANAQAIAALPDLLAALEMALVQIKQDNDERKAEHRGTQTQIESTLIKAGYTF